MREKIILITQLLEKIDEQLKNENKKSNLENSVIPTEIKNLILQDRRPFLADLVKNKDSYNKKIENEKKSFIKSIFNPQNRLGKLTGYSENEKKVAVNSFFSELVEIKEEFNSKKINGYHKFQKQRGSDKNYMNNFYQDIKKQKTGLNTEIYRNKLYQYILDSTKEDIEKIDDITNSIKYQNIKITKQFIYFYGTMSEIGRTQELKSFYLTLKEKVNKDVLEFKKRREFLREKKILSSVDSFILLEKIKYMEFYFLEIIFLFNPEKIDEFVNKKNEIIQVMKSTINDLIISADKVSKKSANKDYYNEGVQKYEKEFNKNYDFSSLKRKLNSENTNFEEIFEEIYFGILHIEYDNLDTIKDYISFSYISYLMLNDLIAELKYYLEIIRDVRGLSNKQLIDKQKEYYNIYNNSNFSNLEEMLKKGIETREEYIEYFKEYEKLLYFKFAIFRLFPISNTSFFYKYEKLIKCYIEILEEIKDYIPHLFALSDLLQVTLPIINKYFF